MILPKKGKRVPIQEVYRVCMEHPLIGLWRKIKKDRPKRQFKSDG